MTLKLLENANGTYTVDYEWKTYRFLLDDGRTIDVKAVQDDSNLREAVRITTKAKALAGVAYLNPTPVEEEPKKPPVKRRARAAVTEDV
jgi:hypothetical protein